MVGAALRLRCAIGAVARAGGCARRALAAGYGYQPGAMEPMPTSAHSSPAAALLAESALSAADVRGTLTVLRPGFARFSPVVGLVVVGFFIFTRPCTLHS